MDEQAPTIGRVVPYLLFVGSVFMTGFVLIVVNVPIAWQFARVPRPVDAMELLRRYADFMLAFIAVAGSASAFLAFVLASLVSGFVVNMIAEGVATIVGYSVMGLARLPGIKRVVGSLRLFTYATYFEEGHAAFRLWLLANPPAKLQWEWELFNFALYWGLTTNLLIALCSTSLLLGAIVWGLLVVGLFVCAYSLLRSWILLRYQLECVESMRASALRPDPLAGKVEAAG